MQQIVRSMSLAVILGAASVISIPTAALAIGDDGEYAGTTSYAAPDEMANPLGPICDGTGWKYHITDQNRRLSVFERTSLVNRTGSRATMSVTSSESGTSSFTVGTTVSASASVAIFAEIKAEVNAEVSKSVTATIGFGGSVGVPAHSTMNADYGVMKSRAYGKSFYFDQHCNSRYVNWTWSAAPWRKTWRFTAA